MKILFKIYLKDNLGKGNFQGSSEWHSLLFSPLVSNFNFTKFRLIKKKIIYYFFFLYNLYLHC